MHLLKKSKRKQLCAKQVAAIASSNIDKGQGVARSNIKRMWVSQSGGGSGEDAGTGRLTDPFKMGLGADPFKMGHGADPFKMGLGTPSVVAALIPFPRKGGRTGVSSIAAKKAPGMEVAKGTATGSVATEGYREVSAAVDDHLIKKRNLDTLQTKYKDAQLGFFYIKMLSIADAIMINQRFAQFTYGNGMKGLRVPTENLMQILEETCDSEALDIWANSLTRTCMDNALKLLMIPTLLKKGIKVPHNCITIDEHLFEMMYHKIVTGLEAMSDLVDLCKELDHMLFLTYTENYSSSTGRLISSIGNKLAFPNPIYKQQGTVNYLSTSSAQSKPYMDYLVVVFGSLLIMNCTEFLSVHMAVERNIDLISTLMRRLNNAETQMIFSKIDPDYASVIFDKLIDIVFHKNWATHSQISQVLHDVIFNLENLDWQLRTRFCIECIKRMHKQNCNLLKNGGTNPAPVPSIPHNLEDAFHMLTKSTDKNLLAGIRDGLREHPVYAIFDRLLIRTLERMNGGNKFDKHLLFMCLLFRDETILLIKENGTISLDPEDANSVVNLMRLSSAICGDRLIGCDALEEARRIDVGGGNTKLIRSPERAKI